MALAVTGFLLAAWAASAHSLGHVLVDFAVLGAAYGVCQFCGLLRAQQTAKPATLGSVIGAHQVLTYTGFALPHVMSLVGDRPNLSPPTLLLAVAVLAALTWAASTLGDRHLRNADLLSRSRRVVLHRRPDEAAMRKLEV